MVSGEAQDPLQYFLGVLAETRGAPLDAPVRLREVHRLAVHAHVPHLAMVGGGPEPEIPGARIEIDAFLGLLHGRHGYSGVDQQGLRVVFRTLPRPAGEVGVEGVLLS